MNTVLLARLNLNKEDFLHIIFLIGLTQHDKDGKGREQRINDDSSFQEDKR